MAAANAQIGVAEAAFYPTITLSADYGVMALQIAKLFTDQARFWAFGEHQLDLRLRRSKGRARRDHWFKQRQAYSPCLLRRFKYNFLPAFGALPCCDEQSFFTSRSGHWNNAIHTELGRFFERPFERVKLHDGQQQRFVE